MAAYWEWENKIEKFMGLDKNEKEEMSKSFLRICRH